MKIYTKKGDTGETTLAGGKRVKKNDILLDAYGTIDELNANIGLIIAEDNQPILTMIQNQLFVVAGMLATEPELWDKYWKTSKVEQFISIIENEIDSMSEDLPALNSFILPQGSRVISQVHVSRTVCRRAERIIVSLTEQNDIYNPLLRFVNRLSDFLFILARFYHHKTSISETYWKSEK